ncbi:MAG: cysteine desulfurase [Acidobacteria bacterium]|nr:cysteine desulfurase [Acidobacteriota bacterium]MCG2814369.1 cysteine desulfurase [Candidatus Aminicenantes bacterium]MBU1338508.1 cysteine desulfurase [Acidobacteriota bacterium]MBU1475159.1 cysteine desulfurase [Acidobacteriota bacterium]MBU2438761.1 cysteine desulfurase [Acidobacteriota bacterium]
MVYLDNNATTPMDPAVCKRMADFQQTHFGNPSSLYPLGREVKEQINAARETIADSLGVSRSEIIFTGSGTESDNFAIRGSFSARPDKKTFITSAIEHPAVVETAHYLDRKGIRTIFIPVDSFGVIRLEELEKALSDDVGLISIMHANNELGTIQPVAEVVRLAGTRNIPVHTDGVQSFGKIGFEIADLGVDFLSISAHKIYGPKGVGALYAKKGTPIEPLIYGGHQERLMRAGTENSTGIIGFGEAVRILKKNGKSERDRIRRLSRRLKAQIEETIPKIKFNGHPKNRIESTLNFSFFGLEAEAVLLALATREIYVSTGSACSEDSEEVSHVLSAIGLRPEEARASIRMSLGRFSTEEDVDAVLTELPKIIQKLRAITALDI